MSGILTPGFQANATAGLNQQIPVTPITAARRFPGQLPPPPTPSPYSNASRHPDGPAYSHQHPPQIAYQQAQGQRDENTNASFPQASYSSHEDTPHDFSSSSSVASFSQWQASNSHISSDLRAFVIRQFQLSTESQDDLAALEDILQATPGMEKSLAVTTFFSVACQLRSHDFLVAQHGGQDARELRRAYEKLIEIANKDRSFVLTGVQQKNVRTYTNHASFDENLFETDGLANRVLSYIQANKGPFGFDAAFATASTVASFQASLSTTATSVMGSWRLELIHSTSRAMGKTLSLIQFIRDQYKKYTKGSLNPITLKHGHVVRLTLMRGFILDRRELMKIKGQAATKRINEEIEREEPTHLTTPEGELVPVPAMPGVDHFWRVWNWWIECRKIELGGDMNSLKWKEFIYNLIITDTREFKHPANDACPHVQEVLNASLAGLRAALQDVPALSPPSMEDEEDVAAVDPILAGTPSTNAVQRRRAAFSGTV